MIKILAKILHLNLNLTNWPFDYNHHPILNHMVIRSSNAFASKMNIKIKLKLVNVIIDIILNLCIIFLLSLWNNEFSHFSIWKLYSSWKSCWKRSGHFGRFASNPGSWHFLHYWRDFRLKSLRLTLSEHWSDCLDCVGEFCTRFGSFGLTRYQIGGTSKDAPFGPRFLCLQWVASPRLKLILTLYQNYLRPNPFEWLMTCNDKTSNRLFRVNSKDLFSSKKFSNWFFSFWTSNSN